MSIYNLNNMLQDEIGHGDHWMLFQRFRDTQFYQIVLEELESYIEKCSRTHNPTTYINSAFAACEILPKLETRFPNIVQECPYDQRAGLLGMILWNFLARHRERWYFYNDDSGVGDGKVYFRSQK